MSRYHLTETCRKEHQRADAPGHYSLEHHPGSPGLLPPTNRRALLRQDVSLAHVGHPIVPDQCGFARKDPRMCLKSFAPCTELKLSISSRASSCSARGISPASAIAEISDEKVTPPSMIDEWGLYQRGHGWNERQLGAHPVQQLHTSHAGHQQTSPLDAQTRLGGSRSRTMSQISLRRARCGVRDNYIFHRLRQADGHSPS